MKRLFVLILTLAFLCGCAAQDADRSTAPTEVSESGRPLILVIDDGHVEETWDWAWFYWNTRATGLFMNEDACTIEITYRYPANELEEAREFHSTLSYDGEYFTLTEDEGTFRYKYLVYSCSQMPEQSSHDFAEYFLLSDDPEITADAYFRSMLSSSTTSFVDVARTRIVYSDYHDFDRAVEFGQVPTDMQQYLEPDFWSDEDAYRSNFLYMAEDMDDTTVFVATAADELPSNVQPYACLETADGYVLIRRHHLDTWKLNWPLVSYLPSYWEIIATGYDAEGAPQWQTVGPIFVQ